MFVRAKKSGAYQYLQLVRSERVDGHVRQQVIATLGRLDVLQDAGRIDALIASCARFAERTAVLEAHERGQTEAVETIKIILGVGQPLIGRLLVIDGLDMKFSEISISKDLNCPICKKENK